MNARVLLVAESDDPLLLALSRRLPGALICTERELYAAPLMLSTTLSAPEASAHVAGQRVALDRLDGLLFRPSARDRAARPRTVSAAYRRHEIRAAWCAVLGQMACRVVNRPPPLSFIDERLWRVHLLSGLQQALALPDSSVRRARIDGIGMLLMEGRPLEVPAGLADARALLESRADAVQKWASAEGLGLVRIHWHASSDGLQLSAIDPWPSFNKGHEDQLDQVAVSLAQGWK